MEHIKSLYQQIIHELNDERRSLIKLTESDVQKIQQEILNFDLKNKLNNEVEQFFTQLFCVLTNTQTTSSAFHSLLISFKAHVLNTKNKEIVIFYLAAIQKQFIEHSLKNGDRIPFDLILTLKDFLNNKDPEVLEWTLRTIDSMGPQAIILKNEILSLRPSLTKIFNEHQKNVFQIIDHMKLSWEKSKNAK